MMICIKTFEVVFKAKIKFYDLRIRFKDTN